MNHKINTEGTVALAPSVNWIPVSPDTPRGVKMLLISDLYGVAHLGLFTPEDKFFTHWAPLPTFKKDVE